MLETFLSAGDPSERAAVTQLSAAERYPGLEIITSKPILRLFRFDGLGSYFAWTLWQESVRYRVRRVIWDRRNDRRLGTPRTFGAEGYVATEPIERLIAALPLIQAREKLPIIGVDGSHYGIELTLPRPTSVWWWGGELDATPHARWFEQAVSVLQLALPQPAA